MEAITSEDLRTQVAQVLREQEGRYDVDAVVAGVVERWGLVDLDVIPSEELWALVAEHEQGDAPDPVEAIQTALVAAIVATPVGGTARIVYRGVEVGVYGASRVRHSWPQPLADLVIGGEPVSGEEVTSWADLAARVMAAVEAGEADQAAARQQAQVWHGVLQRAEREVTAARHRRDQAIAAAVAAGVTPYRIAQDLGVAESTVGRLLRGRK